MLHGRLLTGLQDIEQTFVNGDSKGASAQPEHVVQLVEGES